MQKSKVFNKYIISSSSLILLITLPILLIIYYSLGSDSETLIHLKETVLSGYIINTLKIIFFVSIISAILGVVSAYITTFYDFKFKSLFVIALALPFVIPTYILGYIYSDLFGFFGPVHMFIKSLGIKGFFDVLNINSVVVILALGLYPYVYLIVKSSFTKNSATLLNPALSLGASKTSLFFKIILPLSRPAIIGSLSLVIMECVNEYGVVAYYGVDTLSTAIYTSWFGLNDPMSAAYLSVIAMSIILIILLVERVSRGNSAYKSDSTNKELKKEKAKGIKLIFIYGFLLIPVVLGFLIPFIWIIKNSYIYALEIIDEEFFEIIINSFVASSISALVIVLLALIISYSVRIYPSTYSKFLPRISTLGYAMPGVVIGIGVLSLFGDFDNFLIDNNLASDLVLSGTIFALIFGYTVRFLAVGINTVDSSFEKVSINVNKASRNLGYNYFQTLIKVEIPIMKSALFFAFLLSFVDTIKELPLTLILRPFNYETLATKTYELANNTMVPESSIYALTIILICFIPMIITTRNQK